MSISNEIEEYYRELELEVGASLEEVNKAFRGLADIYHPDRFQNNPEARRKGEEKLKKINLAREKIKKYLASLKPEYAEKIYDKPLPYHSFVPIR